MLLWEEELWKSAARGKKEKRIQRKKQRKKQKTIYNMKFISACYLLPLFPVLVFSTRWVQKAILLGVLLFCLLFVFKIHSSLSNHRDSSFFHGCKFRVSFLQITGIPFPLASTPDTLRNSESSLDYSSLFMPLPFSQESWLLYNNRKLLWWNKMFHNNKLDIRCNYNKGTVYQCKSGSQRTEIEIIINIFPIRVQK